MPDQLQELANLANPSRAQDYAPPQAIEPPQQQFNGWEGTTGKVAGLAGNFLSGLSRGRSMAFARSEQQKANAEKSLLSAMQAVSQSQLPDSLKQEQSVELQRMFGNVILGQIEGSQPKGKKGGGQSGGDGQDQQHPGHHVLGAIKGILEGALGPGRQKQAYTPEEIKAKTDGVFQTLGNYQNSVQGQVQKLDQQLQNRYKELNGDPEALAKDAKYNELRGAIHAVNGNQPSPFETQIAQTETSRQAAAKTSEEKASEDEKKALAVAARSRAAYDDASTKKLLESAPPGPKVPAELDKRIQTNKILAAPPGAYPPEVVQAAREEKKALETAQRGADIRIVGSELTAEQKRQKISEEKLDRSMSSISPGSKQWDALAKEASTNPSLDIGAWDYIATQKLDVRGQGKEATRQAEKIKARAGQIMNGLGLDSGDVFSLRYGVKANASALSKITTQAAQVEVAEGTLQRNIETAKKLDAAFQRGDIQFINRIQAAIKTGKGDKEALDLRAQLHGVAREWAKIMQGQTGAAGVPISEAKDAEDLMSTKLSHGQLSSLFDLIEQDAQNRRQSNEAEQARLLGKIKAFTSDPKEATQAPPGGPSQSGPPQGKSDKNPPSNRPSLEQIFGK